MKLQNIKSKEVVRILESVGFKIERQNGTHVILRKESKIVVVPVHKETMPIGTLKILKSKQE